MSNYPLVEALGVLIEEFQYTKDWTNPAMSCTGSDQFLRVRHLEAALAKAPVVASDLINHPGYWGPAAAGDTHTARLLCVQPTRKDTAESLLREFANLPLAVAPEAQVEKLQARARSLLRDASAHSDEVLQDAAYIAKLREDK